MNAFKNTVPAVIGYHLVAFLTVAIWGSTFVFTKILLLNGLSPAQIFTLRFIIAYLLLMGGCLLRQRFKLFADSWLDEMVMLLLGITGGSLYFLTENMSMLYTTATNTSLIVCTCPLFAMLLIAIVYRKSEHITLMQALGSLIACLGMAVVVLNGHFVLHLSPLGDLLAFCACLCWAFYSLLMRAIQHRYDTLFITRKVFFYGLVTILPYYLLEPGFPPLEVLLRADVLWNLLFLSVVASMLCFVMWNWAIAKLGAVVTTNWGYFNPVTTVLFACWLLHEQITVWFLLGGGLIIAGMMLLTKKTFDLQKTAAKQLTKKSTLAVIALLCCLATSAQETYRYAEKDSAALYLDIFRPDSSAQTTFKGIPKPAIMYVFGGGFVSGSRSDKNIRKWFSRLTANGYAVVAIDYRLGMKGYKLGKGLRGALKALDRFVLSQQLGVEDVFSAVSFLAAHPELNVPVDNIVLSGSSAGAIISLACACAIANGDTEGLPEGFAFKGVMSFAGGIISKKGAPKFSKTPCPLLLFHGTADKIVSYKHYGAFRRGMWGSSYIASQLKDEGWNYSIWRFSGLAHEVAGYMPVMWDVEKGFLEKNVMQGIPCNVDAIVNDPSLPTWGSRKAKTADLYQKKR